MLALLGLLHLPFLALAAAPPSPWAPDAVVQHLDQAMRAIDRERESGGFQSMDPLAGQLHSAALRTPPRFEELSTLALQAAPDSVGVWWGRLQSSLQQRSPTAIAHDGLGFLKAAFSDPWVQIRGLTVLGLALCTGAWIAVAALVLFHGFACWGLLLHDYRDSFPRRLRRVTPAAFFLFLLSVLWVAGVGPLVTLTLFGLMFTPYMGGRARITFGLAVFVGCLLPLVYGQLSREMSDEGEAAWATYRVWRGDAGPDLFSAVEHADVLDEGPRQYLLARLARRAGNLGDAEQFLNAPGFGAEAALVANERGNLALLSGDLSRALVLYREAASASVDDPVPLLNQHLVHLGLLELDAADAALRSAQALGGGVVDKFAAGNSAVADSMHPISHQIPLSWIFKAYLSGEYLESPEQTVIRNVLFLPGSLVRPEFIGLFALFAAIIASRARQERRSRRCPSCGFVICPRCSRRVKGSALCSACWNSDKDRDVDSTAKARREANAKLWSARARLGRRVAAAVLPGCGDFFGSAVWRGASLLLLWTGGSGLLLAALLHPIPLLPGGGLTLHWLPGAAVMGISCVIGVRAALRRN